MDSQTRIGREMLDVSETRPILVVPYTWIGDFVRCHSVVRLLNERFPHAPVDLLASPLCAPIANYMKSVRKAVVVELPHGSFRLRERVDLARRLRVEGYGRAIIASRAWKAALAPFLAGIPERTGFMGEARLGLINDRRPGERELPRMIDRCAALALPKGAPVPAEWPVPQLEVPPGEIATWRSRMGLHKGRPIVALCPGSVAAAKRWPSASYAELARRLAGENVSVWVLGGPAEKPLAAEIVSHAGPDVRDLTGTDLREAIIALAAADAAVTNDSGLMHVAAALGTPTFAIFGPTSAWHWAPLNPLAGVIEIEAQLDCKPCQQQVCPLGHHRCMRDITTNQVLAAMRQTLEGPARRMQPSP